MTLSATGRPAAEVLSAIESFRGADVRWKDGRAFSLAYYAGAEVHGVANAALSAFSSENALNLDAFPSLRHMQNDVIATVCALLGGDQNSVGVFTSGGTESGQAVKAHEIGDGAVVSRRPKSCCRPRLTLHLQRPRTISE